jgi:Flp pilus assembly protein TadG
MMMKNDRSKIMCRRFEKRAAVAAWTMISMTTLLGFAALAVDLGHVRVVNSELQNAADAAAMAGVSALLNPGELTGEFTQADLARFAIVRAKAYANKNFAEKKSVYLDASDVVVGHISDPKNLSETISPVTRYNAVKVVLKKSADSPNGAASLFFAQIWGKRSTNLETSATAYLDGRMVAYKPDPGKGINPAIPVSVKYSKWLSEIDFGMGQDNYGYDPATGQITLGPDGIPELSIFPEKQKTQTEDGAGDFGLLHIGNDNQGTTEVAQQIRTGLDETDVVNEFGDTQINFYNDNGDAIVHVIGGTPGAKNSLVQLEDDFRSRLGTVIGFFTHTTIAETGANADYTINSMQFGRVMMVDGQGSVNGGKAIVIQPVAYFGGEIITGDNAPVHSTAGRVQLIR